MKEKEKTDLELDSRVDYFSKAVHSEIIKTVQMGKEEEMALEHVPKVVASSESSTTFSDFKGTFSSDDTTLKKALVKKECSACRLVLKKDLFSNTQWSKCKEKTRRCKECILKGNSREKNGMKEKKVVSKKTIKVTKVKTSITTDSGPDAALYAKITETMKDLFRTQPLDVLTVRKVSCTCHVFY